MTDTAAANLGNGITFYAPELAAAAADLDDLDAISADLDR